MVVTSERQNTLLTSSAANKSGIAEPRHRWDSEGKSRKEKGKSKTPYQ
jgi:hypothetical protein